MGSGNRGGFVVDKGEATECDFGLGLKMMMMGNHHHNHNHHTHDEESGSKFPRLSDDQSTSSPGGSSGVSGGGIGNFGAMFSRNNLESSTNNPTSSTMYGHVRSSIASAVQRSSGSFDPSCIKSQGGSLMGLGGGGGETARVFTASQRQELERQTIIYKYMAASMPIPPELLIPITSKYPSRFSFPAYQSIDHGSNGGKSGLDLRYTIGSKDAEPWRCRRTDGKKWRCSRDVAPDQKYCERHSHKGRPSRSRKLVESSSASSSPSSISNARTSVNPANMNIKQPSFLHQSSPSMFLPQHHQNSSQSGQSRFPEWFMKREGHNDDSRSGSVFFPESELDQMNPTRTSNLFMGSDQNQAATLPRQFLDAWSIGSKSDGIVDPADSGSSLLTLSMSGGGTQDSSDEARRGMGLFETEKGGGSGGGERYSWMGSSAPGGPLAEALCLGIVGAADAGGGSSGPGEGGGGQEGCSK